MNINELITGIIGTHFIAGAAGGLARSFTVKQAWAVSVMRALAGAMSAHYITPIILFAINNMIEISQEDLIGFNDTAGSAIAFIIGLMGMFLSIAIEKLITSFSEILVEFSKKWLKL